MSQITYIALHGFLGKPEEWRLIFPDEHLIAFPVGRAKGFVPWTDLFIRWVKGNTTPPRCIVGYSMGGRLALHALLQEPELFNSALLISTHPGLEDIEEKKKRQEADAIWARRFMSEPWVELMRAWEAQSVFQAAKHRPLRKEVDYNREELAGHLNGFSLGRQENLLPQIACLEVPILWITGQLDLRFVKKAEEAVSTHPLSSHVSIPNASHRVHLEFPSQIKKQML